MHTRRARVISSLQHAGLICWPCVLEPLGLLAPRLAFSADAAMPDGALKARLKFVSQKYINLYRGLPAVRAEHLQVIVQSFIRGQRCRKVSGASLAPFDIGNGWLHAGAVHAFLQRVADVVISEEIWQHVIDDIVNRDDVVQVAPEPAAPSGDAHEVHTPMPSSARASVFVSHVDGLRIRTCIL